MWVIWEGRRNQIHIKCTKNKLDGYWHFLHYLEHCEPLYNALISKHSFWPYRTDQISMHMIGPLFDREVYYWPKPICYCKNPAPQQALPRNGLATSQKWAQNWKTGDSFSYTQAHKNQRYWACILICAMHLLIMSRREMPEAKFQKGG